MPAKKKRQMPLLEAAEAAITELLAQDLELTDRLAVIDRAIKLETLRNKIDEDPEGSMFDGGDE